MDTAPARDRSVLPLHAEAFDDYSVFVPPAPGDRYGVELRVRLYRPDAPGPLPRPDGRRVRAAANGVIAAYEVRYVLDSKVPAPARRGAGPMLHY